MRTLAVLLVLFPAVAQAEEAAEDGAEAEPVAEYWPWPSEPPKRVTLDGSANQFNDTSDQFQYSGWGWPPAVKESSPFAKWLWPNFYSITREIYFDSPSFNETPEGLHGMNLAKQRDVAWIRFDSPLRVVAETRLR